MFCQKNASFSFLIVLLFLFVRHVMLFLNRIKKHGFIGLNFGIREHLGLYYLFHSIFVNGSIGVISLKQILSVCPCTNHVSNAHLNQQKKHKKTD